MKKSSNKVKKIKKLNFKNFSLFGLSKRVSLVVVAGALVLTAAGGWYYYKNNIDEASAYSWTYRGSVNGVSISGCKGRGTSLLKIRGFNYGTSDKRMKLEVPNNSYYIRTRQAISVNTWASQNVTVSGSSSVNVSYNNVGYC